MYLRGYTLRDLDAKLMREIRWFIARPAPIYVVMAYMVMVAGSSLGPRPLPLLSRGLLAPPPRPAPDVSHWPAEHRFWPAGPPSLAGVYIVMTRRAG